MHKQQIILIHLPSGKNDLTVFVGTDTDHVMTAPLVDYQEMGSPEFITVTIEPGDRLNEETTDAH